MANAKLKRRAAAVSQDGDSNTDSRVPAFLTRALLLGYYPFLVLTVCVLVAVIVLLVLAIRQITLLVWILAPFVVIFAWTLVRLLWAMRVLFIKMPDHEDEMELRVPRDMAPALYEWVDSIAADRALPMPDEIRVAADTVAHIYQRANGDQVLVLGAIAVRAFPQEVLAGIVAHELGHVGAGDTGRGRAEMRAHVMISYLEAVFRRYPVRLLSLYTRLSPVRGLLVFLGMMSTLNPAMWPLRLYHLLYGLARAARSRQQEYGADRHELEEVGKEAAASALILITVSERMPWTRLTSLAESWAQTSERPHLLFEEQARAVQKLDPYEWEEAMRKEFKRSTGLFDSHPGLKDRLGAMGVSSKQALRLIPNLVGSPANELFGQFWLPLEKRLAELLIAPFREAHLVKAELGELSRSLRRLRERGSS
jgi:Zn-dependent protease with chaperone function